MSPRCGGACRRAMPAGKADISGGVAEAKRLHFGVSIRSLRRYKKPRVAILSRAEVRKLRRDLRFTFRIYAIACATVAPTATERRKALNKIQTSAARLVSMPNPSTANDFLTALETRDFHARNLAYRALTARGQKPFQIKKRIRHWTIASSVDLIVIGAAKVLTNLDIEVLVPIGGRFPDPGLAHLVASLIPIWKRATGRTPGPISADKEGGKKKCPFADYLAEMHDLLGVTQPPDGRVVDIVRCAARSKNPAPVTEERI